MQNFQRSSPFYCKILFSHKTRYILKITTGLSRKQCTSAIKNFTTAFRMQISQVRIFFTIFFSFSQRRRSILNSHKTVKLITQSPRILFASFTYTPRYTTLQYSNGLTCIKKSDRDPLQYYFASLPLAPLVNISFWRFFFTRRVFSEFIQPPRLMDKE